MKRILVLCVTATVILIEVSSAFEIGNVLDGKSAISTEYKARFHKIHPNGVNKSDGFIAGVHNMEKNADQESWPIFAKKCAEVIKGIVTALTGAVSSQPGDRTDLHLDFRNRIYHHDTRTHNCSHEEDDDDDEEEEASVLDDHIHGKHGVLVHTAGKIREEVETSPEDMKEYMEYNRESEKAQLQDGKQEECDSQEVTEAAPEPTWNTPATQEILYHPTEQITQAPDFLGQQPQNLDLSAEVPSGFGANVRPGTPKPFFGMSESIVDDSNPGVQEIPVNNEFVNLPPATEIPYHSPPPFPENLPLDTWKPIREQHPDFLPESPVGFGSGQSSPDQLFTLPSELHTTPSPFNDPGFPEAPDPATIQPVVLHEELSPFLPPPESANQVSPLTGSSGEHQEEEECPKESAEGSAKQPSTEIEEKPVGGKPQQEMGELVPQLETATTWNELIPAASTQETYSESVPVDAVFSPAEETAFLGSQPVEPNFGVPEENEVKPEMPVNQLGNILTMFGSTTQPPPSSAIYIPITSSQKESMTEGPADPEEDCCCDEYAGYDDETPTQKEICKNACRDLEQARNELKAIFDKIKKKLRCSKRLT